jgi:hypothetical protein
MAGHAVDLPTRPLDTGIFAVAVGVMSAMPTRVQCFQTLTAAAVVFAILGACGLPPPRRGPRPIPRPRRPGPEVTVRSLTGRWEAVRATPAGPQIVGLSLVQHGDTVRATLAIGDRTMSNDPRHPAHLDARGQFILVFWQLPETIAIRGRPDASGKWIAATINGLDPQPVRTVFQRK